MMLPRNRMKRKVKKDVITVLLGAGAVVEATEVSTNSITEKVIKACKDYPAHGGVRQSVVDYICKAYWENFAKGHKEYKPYSKAWMKDVIKCVNFEDIFHALEVLSGFAMPSGIKRTTSAYRLFTFGKGVFGKLDSTSIFASLRKCEEVINDCIAEYDKRFSEKSGYYARFFEKLSTQFDLDIFTLNYDTWVEQTFKKCNDGFTSIDNDESGLSRFDWKVYSKPSNVRISHLHGCIQYGDYFNRKDINRFAYKDNRGTLYKYASYHDARQQRMRSIKSNTNNQSGESIYRSNIITGLMKTDKILNNPMMGYEHGFFDALTKNKRLMIIGYGFPDIYINNLLWCYQSTHYDDRKVMLVTHVDESQWTPQIEPPLEPGEMSIFADLMFKSDSWFRKVQYENICRGYSENNEACIYGCGFKKVSDEYLSDVMEFMK